MPLTEGGGDSCLCPGKAGLDSCKLPTSRDGLQGGTETRELQSSGQCVLCDTGEGRLDVLWTCPVSCGPMHTENLQAPQPRAGTPGSGSRASTADRAWRTRRGPHRFLSGQLPGCRTQKCAAYLWIQISTEIRRGRDCTRFLVVSCNTEASEIADNTDGCRTVSGSAAWGAPPARPAAGCGQAHPPAVGFPRGGSHRAGALLSAGARPATLGSGTPEQRGFGRQGPFVRGFFQ